MPRVVRQKVGRSKESRDYLCSDESEINGVPAQDGHPQGHRERGSARWPMNTE